MQQIKQFKDSYGSEYGGWIIHHNVWEHVNPFLRQHANQHAHVIDIEHEPIYAGAKESYRIVSVAYSENKKRWDQRLLTTYKNKIDSMIQNQFRNHDVNFKDMSVGRRDVAKIVQYVQNHMPKDQAFDHVRAVLIVIQNYAVSYAVECYQDGQKHNAYVINSHVKF